MLYSKTYLYQTKAKCIHRKKTADIPTGVGIFILSKDEQFYYTYIN